MFKIASRLSAALILSALFLAACSNGDMSTIADAQKAYDQGKYAAARVHLANIKSAGEADGRTRLLYVQVMLKLGHGDAAESALRRIPESELKADQRRILLAHSLILKGRPDRAAMLFEDMDSLSEQEAWLNLWAHKQADLLRRDKTLLMGTIEQFPNNPDILTLGGEYMLTQRKINLAQRFAREAMKVSPDHFGALMLNGHVAIEGDDLKSAHGHFAKAYEKYPENPLAVANLIGVELDMGQVDAAGARLKKGLAKHPSFALLKFQKARYEFAKGKYTEARYTLDDAQLRLGDYAPAFALSAKIATQFGKTETARIEIEKALSLDPENKMAFLALHDLEAKEPAKSAKP